ALPRRRAASDPDGRQLHLSCGAALLNLRVAAEHLGYEAHSRLLPDTHRRPRPARVLLTRTARGRGAENLYDAIPWRHTNRGPFEDRPLPRATVEALVQAAGLEGAEPTVVTQADERETLGKTRPR